MRELGGKTPVVCDYYNASPPSMEAAFELLEETAAKYGSPQRRAALGDMLELGEGEEGFHRALAASLVRLRFEQILLYGKRMQWLHEELQNKGYRGALSHHASHEELTDRLLASAAPGDAILIKGSRSMKMETVWNLLRERWKG